MVSPVFGSPFTDSMPDQASCRPVGRWVWVWLGGTLRFWFGRSWLVLGPGLAHCWVLRRRPGGCFFWSASGSCLLTQPGVGVVGMWGWGVVVC